MSKRDGWSRWTCVLALGLCACGSEVELSAEEPEAQPAFDGHFVAVGAGGLVAISQDGRDWQQAYRDEQGGFFDGVAYASGRWVVVGPGVSVTSSDGERWQRHEGLPLEAFDLIHDGERFVAAGRTLDTPALAAISTSDDGVSWSEPSVIDIDDSLILSLAAGNGVMVAVVRGSMAEEVRTGDTGRPSTLFVRLQGESWTPLSEWLPSSQGHFDKVSFAEGGFVAVGDAISGRSSDGLDWGYAWPDAHLTALAPFDGGWLAMSETGSARSSEGILWTESRIEAPDAPPEWQFAFEDVVVTPSRIVAVGGPEAYNGLSFDGEIWETGFGPSHGTLAEVAVGP